VELPEPSQLLSPKAKTLWRVTGLGWSVAVSIGAGIATGALTEWDDRPGWVIPLLWLIVVAGWVVWVGIEPGLRYRRWRYEIREHEIDIRHGVWSVKRTLVPMARVQHVDTEAGVLQQSFGLATVSFHTAAGETEIPQLEPAQAEAARNRIAELARAERDV
jgi:membrane protein YdbS with pleckstrin-like domain